MNIVIIGAGQAAASCAFRLREYGFTGSITLIGEEAAYPYQRPPLSKKYLDGTARVEDLFIRTAESYTESRIEIHTSQQVETVDRANRKVLTKDGGVFSYDRLVFATGARARAIPVPQVLCARNAFTFRSLADADAISKYMVAGKNMVIIGGGYIGLEIAAVARRFGLNVTLIECADRILQRVACKETSDFVRRFHENNGVKILEAESVTDYLAEDGILGGVRLSSGEILSLDLMVAGIGIQPNSEIAKSIGLEIALDAIEVNANCRTSDQDIYAIGDCASFDYGGRTIRLESVQNALEQADAAAKSILGRPGVYAPKPWFWSDQYSYKIQIAGLSVDHDCVISRIADDKSSASFWYFKGDKLQAVDAISDTRAFMLAKRHVGSNVINKHNIADTSIELKSLFG